MIAQKQNLFICMFIYIYVTVKFQISGATSTQVHRKIIDKLEKILKTSFLYINYIYFN